MGPVGLPGVRDLHPFYPVGVPCISSNDNIQDGCSCASHHILIPASRREEGGRDESTSPCFKDTSWKLPSIGQNAVTWPYLAAREGGKCHSHSRWPKIQGSSIEEGELTDIETISSCCSHSSTSVLMLGKMKGQVFRVFISPAFFLLFLLPDGRFVWPLTHTFQERQ